MAAQLLQITLLCTDYKLLTKMITARLMAVPPSLLLSTQICSMYGHSIFDRAAVVLSAAEFLRRHKRTGFLLSLFFSPRI